MKSITKYMDGWDIAQEIRLERKIHKGSFLLLEGETDYKRMFKFLDEQNCSVAICFGRPNVEEAVCLLEEEGFPGVLGLADADFDRCGGGPPVIDNIIFSQFHDFDVDWMTDTVIRHYLNEVGDHSKCEAAGGACAILDIAMARLEPLSILRHLNHRKITRISLADFDLAGVYDGTRIDVERLVQGVSRGRNLDDPVRAALEYRINAEIGLDRDWKQFTNGHDILAMLGIMLRSEIGSRRDANTYHREVATHIRLTYSVAEFCESQLSRDIEQWQKNNAPYLILAFECKNRGVLRVN